MSFFAIKKSQPTVNKNGTQTFFNVNLNHVNTAIQYFSEKMIHNEQIQMTSDGLYTWILKPSGFYAIKTFSKQEIGTLHANLDVFSGKAKDNPVQAAGEMKITREEGQIKVFFNLLSGTYMKRIFSSLSSANIDEMQIILINKVKQHLAQFRINAEFLDCKEPCSQDELLGGQALLESANIRTSAENMEILKSMFLVRNNVAKGGVRRSRRSRRRRLSLRQRRYKQRQTRKKHSY